MSLFINDINLNMEIKFDFEILCKNIRVLDLYDVIYLSVLFFLKLYGFVLVCYFY